MPRKPRIESSNGLYHVINRGNYRSSIFDEEGAKASFEKALFEACERFAWRLHAHCLMSNHFHLCISTPRGGLSEGMRWLQATYATRFNRFRKEQGHLFQGRFKSLTVEPGSHFRKLVDYIHLNPVRAGLVNAATLSKYRWTSLWHFPKRSSRPSFFDPEWMEYTDNLSDSMSGWRRYILDLRLRETEDPNEARELDREMCRGWCIGGSEFKAALITDLTEGNMQIKVEQDELNDFNRTHWHLLLKKGLKKLGKGKKEVRSDAKGANWKLALASKLKRETSVSNAWLAEQLHMGAPNAVSAACGRYRKDSEIKCSHARKLRNLKSEH